MKIGIITFHRAVNYGAVLQSYALCKKVRSFENVECKIIDYRSKFIENYYNSWYLFAPRNWKRLLSYILFNGNLKPNKERLFGFLKRNQCLNNKPIETLPELKDTELEFDRIISGSDQVWSPLAAGFDSAYFITFCCDNKKKGSYAASIGVSTIPESIENEYRIRLKGFNNYSVREKSAKDIIQKLFPNANVTVDVDPTLLLSGDDWRKVISLNDIRPSIINNQKYVLVYCISPSDKLFDIAKKVAKDLGCEILYITDRWRSQSGVQNMRKVNIDEWLYLFDNAQYIVTDSFHGTAFSINLGKQFYTYQDINNKRSTRILSLLGDLQLEQRIISEESGANVNCNIDYEDIRRQLEILKQRSTDNLRSIVYGA